MGQQKRHLVGNQHNPDLDQQLPHQAGIPHSQILSWTNSFILEQSCCREVSFESSGPIGQVEHLLIHVIFIFLARQSPSWLGSTVVSVATQRAGSSTRKTRRSCTMLSTLLTSLRLGSSPPLLMTWWGRWDTCSCSRSEWRKNLRKGGERRQKFLCWRDSFFLGDACRLRLAARRDGHSHLCQVSYLTRYLPVCRKMLLLRSSWQK